MIAQYAPTNVFIDVGLHQLYEPLLLDNPVHALWVNDLPGAARTERLQDSVIRITFTEDPP